MTVALIILAALVVTGLPLYLIDRYRRFNAPGDDTIAPPAEPSEGECCGMHITCEKDSLLASVSTEIEYYDDEELDVFAGRAAETYSDEEIEQFRDVMLTLLADDIAGWARSIQLRGITLPVEVRDELLMIVAEERQKHH